jgi:hypothetical protein
MSEQGPEGGNNASAGAGGDNTGDQAGKDDAAKTTADAATAQKGPPESAGAATDASNSGTTAVAATTSDQKVAGDVTGTPDGTGGDNTGVQVGKDDTARVAAGSINKSETGTLNDTAKTGDTEKLTPVIAGATTAEKGPASPAKVTTDGTGDTTARTAAATSDQKVAGDVTGTPDGTGGDNTGVQVGKDDTARVAAGSINKSETGTLNDTAKTGDAANATAVTATEATAQIGPAQPMKASGAADVLGDGDRVELRQTVHGAERAADPSRLSPAQQAEVIKNSTDTYTQADGATVHEQNVNGRYNIVVVNSKDFVVTNVKTMEPEGRDRLAKRYGWVKN